MLIMDRKTRIVVEILVIIGIAAGIIAVTTDEDETPPASETVVVDEAPPTDTAEVVPPRENTFADVRNMELAFEHVAPGSHSEVYVAVTTTP